LLNRNTKYKLFRTYLVLLLFKSKRKTITRALIVQNSWAVFSRWFYLQFQLFRNSIRDLSYAISTPLGPFELINWPQCLALSKIVKLWCVSKYFVKRLY